MKYAPVICTEHKEEAKLISMSSGVDPLHDGQWLFVKRYSCPKGHIIEIKEVEPREGNPTIA